MNKPVLRMDYSQPHEAVLIHPNKTSSRDLLLQKTFRIQMVIIPTMTSEPFLNIDHRPGIKKLQQFEIEV